MTRRHWYAVSGLIAVVLLYGDFRSAQATQSRLDSFEADVCHISTAQRAGSAHFRGLLVTLEQRAVARETVDRHAGNFTAAQADHDSAELYQQVLAETPAPSASAKPLGC